MNFCFFFFFSIEFLCSIRLRIRLNWITFQRNNKTLLMPNRRAFISMEHNKLVHIFEFQVKLKRSNCSHSILLALTWLDFRTLRWFRLVWCTCHNQIMLKVLSMSFLRHMLTLHIEINTRFAISSTATAEAVVWWEYDRSF